MNLDGGTLAYTPNFYYYGVITTLPIPIRDGCVFMGWYTARATSAGYQGTKMTEISATTTGTVTLYAVWREQRTVYWGNYTYVGGDAVTITDTNGTTRCSTSFPQAYGNSTSNTPSNNYISSFTGAGIRNDHFYRPWGWDTTNGPEYWNWQANSVSTVANGSYIIMTLKNCVGFTPSQIIIYQITMKHQTYNT